MKSLIAVLVPLLAALVSPLHAQVDPKNIVDEIRNVQLDVASPRNAAGLRLDAGAGTLIVEDGRLYPASRVGGQVVEFIFVGAGRVEFDPQEPIERSQLELFTGSPRLDEEFEEAAFVIANDKAANLILARPVAPLSEPSAKRAADLFKRWKEGTERKQLAVDADMLADAMGDPFFTGLFVGFIRGKELGDFLCTYEPNAEEQITIGQFVPLDATEKEKRKISREIHRAQRRGRLIGLTLDDLGTWDTWVSMTRGKATPSGFTPHHYGVELRVADKTLRATGRSRIDLTAVTGHHNTITLTLPSDLNVTRVADAKGQPLFHHRSGTAILVVLPNAPQADERVTIEIEYEGEIFDRGEFNAISLRDPRGWYPRIDDVDRATYDVTFRWPRKLTLLSMGKRVDGGEKGDEKWERRVVEAPAEAFGFEIGRYRTESFPAGHVTVTLAFDPEGRALERTVKEEIRTAIKDALAYFEETYGAYPLDALTILTVPRSYSNAMLGFVCLSNSMMYDFDIFGPLLGIEDRRTVIAHELAHQWWGHRVTGASYHDTWLAEGMANYAAMQFARKKLGDEAVIGPTARWQESLTDVTEDGRSIESLGPVVLGPRLNSSRAEAYEPIIYRKGAVVLDMLATTMGRDNFDRMLKELVQKTSEPISTLEFLKHFSTQLSSIPVGAFAKQFVYGTGMPEIDYTYEIVPSQKAGEWIVKGVARQQSPIRFDYRIEKRGENDYAIVRKRRADVSLSNWTLVTPIQIAVLRQDGSTKLSKSDRERGNATVTGRLRITGEEAPFSMEIPYEPKSLWIDRNRESLARFYSENRNRRRVLLRQANALAAEEKFADAESMYRKAAVAEESREIETELYIGDLRDEVLRAENAWLVARAHLGLAQVLLDTGRHTEVPAALSQAKKAIGMHRRDWINGEVGVFESAIDLRTGENERAFKRLRKLVLGKYATVDDPEAYALLAIAAKKMGRSDELKKALDAAKRKGVDVSALE